MQSMARFRLAIPLSRVTKKQKRSYFCRATTFNSNLLTLYLKQVTIKIQRGAIVVDGLPLN